VVVPRPSDRRGKLLEPRAPMIEIRHQEMGHLRAFIRATKANSICRVRRLLERFSFLVGECVSLRIQSRSAVGTQEGSVRGIDGHEVPLRKHVPSDQIGDAVAEQRSHQPRTSDRVIACWSWRDGARDVVNQPGDLEFQVIGHRFGEEPCTLEVVSERGDDVTTTHVAQHRAHLLDRGERWCLHGRESSRRRYDRPADRARRGARGSLYPQSTHGGLNSRPRLGPPHDRSRLGVEGRVLRNGIPRTESGPEGSSSQRTVLCAAGKPGLSCVGSPLRGGPESTVGARSALSPVRRPPRA